MSNQTVEIDVTWFEQTTFWFDSDRLQLQHRNYLHTHCGVDQII